MATKRTDADSTVGGPSLDGEILVGGLKASEFDAYYQAATARYPSLQNRPITPFFVEVAFAKNVNEVRVINNKDPQEYHAGVWLPAWVFVPAEEAVKARLLNEDL